MDIGEECLRKVGPMVPATWMVTPEREAQLRMLGGNIPSPVRGHLLLDTGAGHLMIERYVAQQLKLTKLGKTRAYGIGGIDEFEQYEAILLLPIIPLTNPQPFPVSIGFPVKCPESNLQEHHKEYRTHDGKPLRLIGVLGRTFLQFTKVIYDGINGKIEIHIDQATMDAKKGQAVF